MEIQLINQVTIDGERDEIRTSYSAQVLVKNGYYYFVYKNDEGEKVIIKAGDSDLLMTRYSNPKSIMRFYKGKPALVVIPTPIGVQQLVTETESYHLDVDSRKIVIVYRLVQPQSGAVFAEYCLRLSWG